MPLGRFLRFVDRVTGDNAIGNIAGSIGRGIQRRSNRMDPVESALGDTPTNLVPLPRVVSPPPGPPAMVDTFDRTGTAIGAALGSRFGPAGAGIGAAVGGVAGNAIPVPGFLSPNNRAVAAPALAASTAAGNPVEAFGMLQNLGGSTGGRRVALELLLSSGALNSIIRQPVVYQSMDGRVRYGSDPGYVLIRRMSGNTIQRFQMPKLIARELGFWKPRKKPVISVRDSNAIRRSNAARKRLANVSKRAGLYVRQSAPARRTSTKRNYKR